MRGIIFLRFIFFGLVLTTRGERLDSLAWKKALEMAYALHPATVADASLSEVHPLLLYASSHKPIGRQRPTARQTNYEHTPRKPVLKSYRQPSREEIFALSQPPLQYNFVPVTGSRSFVAQASELQPQKAGNVISDVFVPVQPIRAPWHSSNERHRSHRQDSRRSIHHSKLLKSGTHHFATNSHGPIAPHKQEHVQQPFHAVTHRYHHREQHRQQPSGIHNDVRPEPTNRRQNQQRYFIPNAQASRGTSVRHGAVQEPSVIRVDDIVNIHRNLPKFLNELNFHPPLQDKKTYLIFKTPSLVTTARPASAPYSPEWAQDRGSGRAPFTPATPAYEAPEQTEPPKPRPIPAPRLNSGTLVIDLVPLPPQSEPSPTALTETRAPVLNTDDAPNDVAHQNFVLRPDFVTSFLPSHYGSSDSHSKTPESNYGYASPTDDPILPISDVQADDKYYSYGGNAPTELLQTLSSQASGATGSSISGIGTDYVSKNSSTSASVLLTTQPIIVSQATNGTQWVSYSPQVSSKPKSAAKRQPKSNTVKKSKAVKQKVKHYTKQESGGDFYDNENVPGRPGSDYPVYNEIPFTNFDCGEYKSPGFYADLEAGCQVFHNCDIEMKKHSFMCPNGTVFRQELFICDWWYNVRCDDSPEFYGLNGGLYDSKQPLTR